MWKNFEFFVSGFPKILIWNYSPSEAWLHKFLEGFYSQYPLDLHARKFHYRIAWDLAFLRFLVLKTVKGEEQRWVMGGFFCQFVSHVRFQFFETAAPLSIMLHHVIIILFYFSKFSFRCSTPRNGHGLYHLFATWHMFYPFWIFFLRSMFHNYFIINSCVMIL